MRNIRTYKKLFIRLINESQLLVYSCYQYLRCYAKHVLPRLCVYTRRLFIIPIGYDSIFIYYKSHIFLYDSIIHYKFKFKFKKICICIKRSSHIDTHTRALVRLLNDKRVTWQHWPPFFATIEAHQKHLTRLKWFITIVNVNTQPRPTTHRERSGLRGVRRQLSARYKYFIPIICFHCHRLYV